MKRVMDSNQRDGGGGKRNKNTADGYAEALAEGKFELRYLIPSKCAGAIIGRGGEKIKTIRDKYNATLSVPDKSSPERVFTIVVAIETLTDCFREILENLSDFKELKNKRDEFEVKILIHSSMAGAIIGKGGVKIKELREQTGANLKVFSEPAPMSTDRILLISAPQEKLPDIVRQLVDFMKEIQIKGSVKPYDAANYNPQVVTAYGGYAGASNNFNQAGPPQRMPPRGGNIEPFDSARGGFEPMRNQSYNQPPFGGSGGYNDYNRQPPSYGGNSNYNGGGNPNYPPRSGPVPLVGGGSGYDVTTTQVTIPDELAGTIIGKGGERINSIRQQSGARIDVGSTMYGSNERIITITGTNHQIQSAQYHLQQSVRSSEAGRRYLSQQQR